MPATLWTRFSGSMRVPGSGAWCGKKLLCARCDQKKTAVFPPPPPLHPGRPPAVTHKRALLCAETGRGTGAVCRAHVRQAKLVPPNAPAPARPRWRRRAGVQRFARTAFALLPSCRPAHVPGAHASLRSRCSLAGGKRARRKTRRKGRRAQPVGRVCTQPVPGLCQGQGGFPPALSFSLSLSLTRCRQCASLC